MLTGKLGSQCAKMCHNCKCILLKALLVYFLKVSNSDLAKDVLTETQRPRPQPRKAKLKPRPIHKIVRIIEALRITQLHQMGEYERDTWHEQRWTICYGH